MTTLHRRGLRGMAAAALWGLAAQASAQFDVLSDFRQLTASTYLVVRDGNGDHAEVDIPLTESVPEGSHSWNVTLDNTQSVQSPASEAAASAEASVTQHSLVAAGLIRYASEASASASGFAAPAAQYDAHAYGLSSMFVEFSVGAPLAVYLTLESDAGGPDDFFGFALQREGVIVWDAEQVADPLTGGANGSFRRLLVLQPGLYSVSADLQTSAVGGGLDHAFASAAFSLSPAPEPETWLLMLAGLGCVGALVRRRRRAAAA